MKIILSLRSFALLMALNLAITAPAGAASHTVRKGDTISGIARAAGCTVEKLRSLNQLKGDVIQIGQRLTLPGEKSAAQTPARKPAVPKPEPAAAGKKQGTPSGVKSGTKSEAKSGTEIPPVKPVPGARPKQKEEAKTSIRTKPARPAADSTPDKKGTAGKKEVSALSALLAGLTEEDRWRVQILLDKQGFSPGKVDGLAGIFTEKAAVRWMAARSVSLPGVLLDEARSTVKTVHTQVSIPKTAAGFVGEVPDSHEDQAKVKQLPYRTLAEFMAERFHTDESALRRLNPGRDLDGLRIGQSLTVPEVAPFRIESRERALDSTGAGSAGNSLRILHEENMLEVVRPDGHLAAAFPITVGRKKEHIRTGAWRIVSRTLDPKFLYDKRMLAEGRAGDQKYLLPPGPNNPVGILWMELEPVKGPEAHIGIHGTDSSARIGRNQSSGCIRLANWDIVRLASFTRTGTKVVWSSQDTRSPEKDAAPISAGALASAE